LELSLIKDEINKFDEYRLFIEDTARFSDRRQTVSNIYIAVNSVLPASVAFFFKDVGIARPRLVLVAVPVLAAGIAVCWIWLRLIRRYAKMIDIRVGELRKIESQMDGCHEWYGVMHEEFYAKGPSFSGIEQALPCVFIGLYSFFIVAMALGLCLACCTRQCGG
jgi:hypothetical protein